MAENKGNFFRPSPHCGHGDRNSNSHCGCRFNDWFAD
jgi:hypothetical protein